jgi:hypothetical protein
VVRVFVKPISRVATPVSVGQYLQVGSFSVVASGSWNLQAQIGNDKYPSYAGDALSIVAWLVTPSQSDSLDRLCANKDNPCSGGAITPVARSVEVELTVNRGGN